MRTLQHTQVFLAGPVRRKDSPEQFASAARTLAAHGAHVQTPYDSTGRLRPVDETTDALLASDLVVYLPGSTETLVADLTLAETLGIPVLPLYEAVPGVESLSA